MSLSYIPLCLMSTIFCTNVIAGDPLVSAENPIRIKFSSKKFASNPKVSRYISPRDRKDPDYEEIKRVKTKSAQENKTNQETKVESANALKNF